jgi:DNA-binding MarR family transcriptional regulator
MKNTLLKILIRLTGASRELLELVLPILRDSAARLLAELAPIALEVVRSLADSPHSGQQKREAALREIQTRAVSAGIRASTSAANLAIELAVANLKNK